MDEYHPHYPEANKKRKKYRSARARVIERDGSQCHYCKKELNLNNSTLDHVVPLSSGGDNHMDNYVLACHKCNHDKDKQKTKKHKSST